MKIRNGFVSNSSSSSFVALTFYEKDAIFPDWYNKDYSQRTQEENDIIDEMGDYLIDGENSLWGVNLNYWDQDEDGYKDITKDDLESAKKEIIKFCKDYNVKLDENKLIIRAGSIYN